MSRTRQYVLLTLKGTAKFLGFACALGSYSQSFSLGMAITFFLPRLTQRIDYVQGLCLHRSVDSCVTPLKDIFFEVCVNHVMTDSFIQRYMAVFKGS